MTSTASRFVGLVSISALCVCVPVNAAQPAVPAQSATSAQPARRAPAAAAVPAQANAPAPAPAPASFDDNERGARETREAFYRLLERHPPSVGRIMKLDPTLMQSPDYLATYPAVEAFLAAHPEVARNPSYFLDRIDIESDWRPRDAQSRAFEMWKNMFEGIGLFVMFVTFISSLMWLIRTLIDYRRWARLTRVQQDVHTKLLDRFTNNEDLLTYMRTPAGERFLESAPISLDGDVRPMAAPLRRILMGIQIGLVLLFGGAGMQLIVNRVPEEIAGSISSLGVLAVAVGLGFIASAVASYLLSARLGLITVSSSGSAADPSTRA